ncbi:hypothetical protein QE365_001909 [Acinetobacter baylyi]|nr:hypothetical protein [Acinetobacter baylyi]
MTFSKADSSPKKTRINISTGANYNIAKSAEEAGLLIYNFYNNSLAKFFFNHAFRTYWWELDFKKFDLVMRATEEAQGSVLSDEEIRLQALKNSSSVIEICNAQLDPLYFQRNEITDESWYYFNIQSPWGEVKATFTPEHISSRSKFKPRVMGVLSGAMWTGTDQQLETFIKRKTERLREVKTIDFIGYSKEYDVYIFDQYAVHKGLVIPKNEHDYFKTNKKEIKTLASTPIIHINPKKEFKPTWWRDYYTLNDETGLILLAWWTGSYFAEQIRAMHDRQVQVNPRSLKCYGNSADVNHTKALIQTNQPQWRFIVTSPKPQICQLF